MHGALTLTIVQSLRFQSNDSVSIVHNNRRTDVVEVDTWKHASGKNGVAHDWIFRDCKTGETLANATRFFLYYPVN